MKTATDKNVIQVRADRVVAGDLTLWSKADQRVMAAGRESSDEWVVVNRAYVDPRDEDRRVVFGTDLGTIVPKSNDALVTVRRDIEFYRRSHERLMEVQHWIDHKAVKVPATRGRYVWDKRAFRFVPDEPRRL